MNHLTDIQALSQKLISYLRTELAAPALALVAPLVQLQGGYETAIYRFELDGAPDDLSHPLVLRLYPQFYGTGNAIWESTVQNALVEVGYPVARAHIVCTDMSVLGGAFFIMEHLPGQPLATAPHESVPGLLGKTQAELHNVDPAPLIKTLASIGFTRQNYGLDSRLDWLSDRVSKAPWLRQSVHWLREHRPPEPECLSVCHGDFHPFNMMYDAGKVTGVLDWGGLTIADPAYDVGKTLVLLTIPFKHLAASMGDDFAAVDFDLIAELYLAAYRTHKPLDDTRLGYYRVRRCVRALIEGVEGQQVWQHPLTVRDLIATAQQVTGIQITKPDEPH